MDSEAEPDVAEAAVVVSAFTVTVAASTYALGTVIVERVPAIFPLSILANSWGEVLGAFGFTDAVIHSLTVAVVGMVATLWALVITLWFVSVVANG